MDLLKILYYAASIASIFLYVLSVQCKKKRNILIVQVGASICYLIVYLITGLYSGAATEVLEQSKDLVFIGIEKKKKKIPPFVLGIFLGLLIICGIIFYDGVLSLLPLLINILLFTSTYFKNPQIIRWVMLICGFLWFIYNIYGGVYIICIGNVLEIFSASISLYRFRKKKKK